MKLFHNNRIHNPALLITLLGILSITLVIISLGIGYFKAPLWVLLDHVLHPSGNLQYTTILNIRWPRIIAAYLIGAALSVSGAVYQGILKSPLVSPDILGVASGAGMGAAIAIMLRQSPLVIQLAAFAGGILAVTITSMISRRVQFDRRVSLILSGVLVGSLAYSVTSLLKYFADTQNQLPELIHWLMGSLTKVTSTSLLFALPMMAIGFTILIMMRYRLNVLSLSDIAAHSIGINVRREMIGVIAGSTLLCSSAVCLGGVIGWVGLMIPHISRALVGPQYRKLMPVSALLGGIFLLLMDDVVRSIAAVEIPLGLAISFLGAPFFYLLIVKGKKS